MLIKSLDQLRDFLADVETLYDILSVYTEYESHEDIIDKLKEMCVLCDMADQNDMGIADLHDWLLSNMSASVECRAFNYHSIDKSWPVVCIKCLDKTFYLDWVCN